MESTYPGGLDFCNVMTLIVCPDADTFRRERVSLGREERLSNYPYVKTYYPPVAASMRSSH